MRIYLLIKSFLIAVIVLGLLVIGWQLLGYFNFGGGVPLWENRPPVTLARVSLNLNLDSPDDRTILFNQDILVSGQTLPLAILVVDDDGGYIATEADAQGNFSQRVSLDKGLNELTITAFDKDGNSKTLNRTIYYSEGQL